MATDTPEIDATPTLIPALDPEERKRRGRAAVALVRGWSEDRDSEQDQVETLDVIRRALGPDRIASDRAAFP